MTLQEFLSWFLESKIATLTVTSGEVHFHEKVTTILLVRHNNFQVELVLLKGESVWPGEHRHPDVSSIEVDLNNSVVFTKNGVVRDYPDFQVPVVLGEGLVQNCNCIQLLPTDYHGISKVQKRGSAILSVQEWLNGVAPTSVGFNWDGEPTCEGHLRQLSSPNAKLINSALA